MFFVFVFLSLLAIGYSHREPAIDRLLVVDLEDTMEKMFNSFSVENELNKKLLNRVLQNRLSKKIENIYISILDNNCFFYIYRFEKGDG